MSAAITAQELEAQMPDASQLLSDEPEMESSLHYFQFTFSCVQSRTLNALDWDRLVEKLQDLGNEQKNQLESRLLVLYEHLLKLTYWDQERDYNQRGWP
jgi:hypothetical protein